MPTPTAWAARADGAFEGEVLAQYAKRDVSTGEIWTHTVLRVDRVLKGELPTMLEVRQPGGTVGAESRYDSLYQDLSRLGDAESLFLVREEGGFLTLAEGIGAIPMRSGDPTSMGQLSALRAALATSSTGTDLRGYAPDYRFTKDVTDNGLLGGTTAPSRFTPPDRGEPIGVVVDVSVLPPGISVAEAMGALDRALAAWSAVASVEFAIEGTAVFPDSPINLELHDQRLYIAMGDPYNAISNQVTTLGRGGRNSQSLTSLSEPVRLPGLGGTVSGQAFDRTEYGYVVLDHEKDSLQQLSSFEEVLTHEIGHALGLAHSSEDPNEQDTILKSAMMYYRIEGGGRGALLADYDAEKLRQVHPVGNTPPFGIDRSLVQITASMDISATGVNEVVLPFGDLQGDALTISILEVSENTTNFSLHDGNILRYPPTAGYGDSDAPGTSFYNLARLQISDGVNLSPIISIKISSLRLDSNGDGLPESWVNGYFGGIAPSPTGDADADGITNLQELKWGLDPTVPNQLIAGVGFDGSAVAFTGVAGVPYALERSDNLTDWTYLGFVSAASGENQSISSEGGAKARSFFRIVPVE